MTELEKIERAKMYMDKLANGINPLDGSPVPEWELINNVRMSRCFFFVSEVLRQVIANGGTSVPEKRKKLPLVIPLEKRELFEYSGSPIPVSEIARRVSALAENESMQKLTYSDIAAWLTGIGMLTENTGPDGKRMKRPTAEGLKNGISVETRSGAKGPYDVVVYDAGAQRFIVDNLDAILDEKNSRTELEGAPWTQEHDGILAELYQKAVPIREIAQTLKRKPSGVRARLKKLGLGPG